MSEVTVTHGVAEYRHAVPKAEYNSVTPMVSLSFTVAEGSDPANAASRVMAIAQDIVERAIAGKISVEQVVSTNVEKLVKTEKKSIPVQEVKVVVETEGPEAVKTRVNPPVETSITLDETTAEVTVEDDTGIDIGLEEVEETKPLTIKDDIQPLAQKISAHLRKDGGNINKLRDLIKEMGAASLLSIEPAKFAEFIEKGKLLLKD